MAAINVAIIDNNQIVNVAVFDSVSFVKTANLIPLTELPEGAWVGWQRDAAGEWFDPKPQEPDTPVQPSIPSVCSPAQGLVALYALKGITETDIHTAIASIPDPVQQYTAQIAFNKATEWRRDSQSTQLLASLVSLTETDLDSLFAYAANVTI